jgi:hypothetical protein
MLLIMESSKNKSTACIKRQQRSWTGSGKYCNIGENSSEGKLKTRL